MTLKRHIAVGVARCWTTLRYARQPKTGYRILMYHSVGGQAHGDHRGLFSVTPEAFAGQLQVLRDIGIPCVPFGPPSAATVPRQLAITFDDGYADNLRVAAPLLARQAIPWTLFVTTDFVGRRGYLSRSELRELASQPQVQIGAHGKTHRRLTTLDDDALREELMTSKSCLEDLLGRPTTMLSYPHGAVDDRVVRCAAACGFQVGATSRGGANDPETAALLLKRTEVVSTDSPRIFQDKLRGGWDWVGSLRAA